MLLSIMASTFSKAVILVDFYANQDYIAKNLCINRNRPEMRCKGRCQLCKRLDRDAGQDKNAPDRKPENRSLLVYFEQLNEIFRAPVTADIHSAYPSMVVKAPVDRAASFFHPPGC